jgi:hypothetical protein
MSRLQVEIVEGKLQVEVVDLLERVDADKLMSLADNLAITDQVIQFVVQQILDGWTELDSHAGTCVRPSPDPCTALDTAVREVAKRASEVARKEIERLEETLRKERRESEELSQQLADLRRSPYGRLNSG